jgi:hypothetical protein
LSFLIHQKWHYKLHFHQWQKHSHLTLSQLEASLCPSMLSIALQTLCHHFLFSFSIRWFNILYMCSWFKYLYNRSTKCCETYRNPYRTTDHSHQPMSGGVWIIVSPAWYVVEVWFLPIMSPFHAIEQHTYYMYWFVKNYFVYCDTRQIFIGPLHLS